MTASDQSTTGSSILVIDDNPDILNTVAFALKQAGYDVSTANNGEDGLSLAYDTKPALIVLDMMMPKRSGFLVLEKLRREYDHPIRIIMVTANEGNRHRAYAEMLGVDDYIRKPFAMDRLLESVQKLLS